MGDCSGVQRPVQATRPEDDDTALIRDRKQYLRRSVRVVRRGLSEADRRSRSQRIWERVAGLSCYQQARVLLGYMAFDHEVLTDGLMQQAMASGKQIVLPMVLSDRQDMALYRIEDFDRDVAPGFRGILEPQPWRARAVAPDSLDLALIPGVAFDLRGGRLGLGAGFYDRLLSRLPRDIPTVGLAFDFQVIPRLPLQPHDMVLGAIVTECRVIWGRASRQGEAAEGARFFYVAGERGEG
jgi:5-formyltetrahydrofolate cyclo-ligase